jgi:hypothetical protein
MVDAFVEGDQSVHASPRESKLPGIDLVLSSGYITAEPGASVRGWSFGAL